MSVRPGRMQGQFIVGSISRAFGIEIAVQVDEEDARVAEDLRDERQGGDPDGQEDPVERPGGDEQELPEEHPGRDDRDLEGVAEVHRPGEVAGPALELLATDGTALVHPERALEDRSLAALRAPLLEDRPGTEAVRLVHDHRVSPLATGIFRDHESRRAPRISNPVAGYRTSGMPGWSVGGGPGAGKRSRR